MTITSALIILGVGFVIGWAACALVQARWLCEKLDNANRAMRGLHDCKAALRALIDANHFACGHDPVKFKPGDN